MKCCGKLLSLAGVCCIGSAAVAAAPDNPYRTIVDRNPFGLNPPPVIEPVPPPTNAMPKINITGITGKGEARRAWFTIVPKDPKETQYVNLPEGQRKDSLEVIEIREETGEVTIRYGQTELALNMKEHAPKASAAGPGPAPVSPAVPRPPVAAVAQPQPLVGASTSRGSGYQSGVQVLGAAPTAAAPPQGAGRYQPPQGVQVLGGTSTDASPQRSEGLRSIPLRPTRLAPSGSNTSPQQPPMDPVEQAALMQINEEIKRPEIEAGVHPPFPPMPR